MRRSFAVALFLTLAVSPLALSAQQPTVPTRDPQAIGVLANALAAMGGQNVATVQDTVVQATMTPPASQGGNPGTLTITTKGVNKMRFDGSGGAKTSSVIFNTGSELRSNAAGWHQAPSANASHKRFEHIPVLMLTYELTRTDLSVTYVGVETLAGRSVQHVQLARVSNLGNALDVTLSRNSQIDVWVDAQTMFVVKVAFLYLSETDWRVGLPMEIFYDNYQNTNGLLVPFHQKCLFNGQPLEDMQITSFSVNQSPADSKFEGN